MAFEMHITTRSFMRYYDNGIESFLFWASTVPPRKDLQVRNFQAFSYRPGGLSQLQAKQLDSLLRHCIAMDESLVDGQKVHVFVHNERLRNIILANGSEFGAVKFMSADDCAAAQGHETVMSELSDDVEEYFHHHLVNRAYNREAGLLLKELKAQQKKLLKAHNRDKARASLHVLNIGTDGSYHKSFGKGTYAWVTEKGRHNSGYVSSAGGALTAELTAIQHALKSNARDKVVVHTDSLNAVKMINGVVSLPSNTHIRSLVQDIQTRVVKHADVKVVWVKGHAGHPLNEAADRISRNLRLGRAANHERVLLQPILERIAQETPQKWKYFTSSPTINTETVTV